MTIRHVKPVEPMPVLPVNDGAGAEHNETLLTLLLQRGRASGAGRPVARRLLRQFGGLRRTLNASREELESIEGVGPVKAAAILAMRELAQRYFEETLPVGATIRSPADSETFLRARLRDRPHEVFCCLYLDNRHRVLGFDELFRGTIDGTGVYPREVVKEALARNAAAVILAHNHPSGVAEPSASDERITRRLRSALELVDIRLLDHLVVGDGVSTSMASRGML
jgi:DNA repair protein RadC